VDLNTAYLYNNIFPSPNCGDFKQILTTDNAGGSSELSEALSFMILKTMYPGVVLKWTENDINYEYIIGTPLSITDYVVEINGYTLAVSVARAFSFSGGFTSKNAEKLVRKKINNLINSNINAMMGSKRSLWDQQIIHFITPSTKDADVLITAINKVGYEGRIIITICKSNCIYSNFVDDKKDYEPKTKEFFQLRRKWLQSLNKNPKPKIKTV